MNTLPHFLTYLLSIPNKYEKPYHFPKMPYVASPALPLLVRISSPGTFTLYSRLPLLRTPSGRRFSVRNSGGVREKTNCFLFKLMK